MHDIQIRRAYARDAAALTKVIETAYAPAIARGVELPPVSEGIANEIVSRIVWVGDVDGQVKAGLIATETGDAFHIMNIAVQPAAQGLGLGKALLLRAEHEAVRLGHPTLRLATHVDLSENIALYLHLGWQEDGREGNKVLMSKRVAR